MELEIKTNEMRALADRNEQLMLDRANSELRVLANVLRNELAPHGRCQDCDRPVDEDGECPIWCNQ